MFLSGRSAHWKKEIASAYPDTQPSENKLNLWALNPISYNQGRLRLKHCTLRRITASFPVKSIFLIVENVLAYSTHQYIDQVVFGFPGSSSL